MRPVRHSFRLRVPCHFFTAAPPKIQATRAGARHPPRLEIRAIQRILWQPLRKGPPMSAAPELDHTALMRLAIEESRKARASGVHPFASILVGPDGKILMTQHNAFMPDHDMTGHAERVLMTRASTSLPMDLLRECTIYTSAEPCAMCAGAIYWTGLKRVVYGLSEHALKGITGNHPENRTVFAAGQRQVEVIGPMLEDEAAEVHKGIWG
jgi:tRNA(Arg) A34 adenosine deaminase TadA